MTALLIFTFVLGGAHTLLWLPRALKWRKELKRLEAEEEAAHQSGSGNDETDPTDDKKEVV